MKLLISTFRRLIILLTPFSVGACADVSYVSAKRLASTPVIFQPAFLPKTQTELAAAQDTQSAAPYTSSFRATKDRLQGPNILGNVYFKQSADDENPLTFAIHKQPRGYSAETPLSEGIAIGRNKLTPNFAIGLHKDHRAMVGIVFRMPF